MGRICFFDIETGGLDSLNHPITQFAAIAVDSKWRELEELELKIQFDPGTATPTALEKNHFDAEVWEREAVHQDEALTLITAFFKRHSTFEQLSKAGRPYKVAQLAGHNVSKFDIEFYLNFVKYGQPGNVETAVERIDRGDPERDSKWGPWAGIRFLTLDTLALATWWDFVVKPGLPDLKLETLAKHFGYDLGESAHDALADVRANVVVGKNLMIECWKGFKNSPFRK